MRRSSLIAGLAALGAPVFAAEPLRLSLPVACEIGVACFVQNLFDHDPGPAVRDHACGAATYDGHDGTDIRVRTIADAAADVPVVAPAPGIVLRVRDGIPDRLARTDADRAAVSGRECGNGMVLDHGGGWETQFCHLRRGSVIVRDGQKVERGDKLGLIGFSGQATFPHVHLTVRHQGKAVDPFVGPAESGDGCGPHRNALWTPEASAALRYRRGEVLEVGFAEGPAIAAAIETGELREVALSVRSPAIVAWAWAINLKQGDRAEIALVGPAGKVAENAVVLDRDKAQLTLFSGKKRPADGWPKGPWTARFRVLRDGADILRTERTAGLQ